MQVKDAMSKGVIGVRESADLFDAVETMLAANVSGIFAFNAEGSLVGIVSEGDLLHRTELGSAQRRSRWLDLFLSGGSAARDFAHAHGRTVADVMTRFIVSISEDAEIAEAIDIMTERHFKRLPVVRGDQVVGVIARSDILRALHRAQAAQVVPGAKRPDVAIQADLDAAIAGQAWATSNAVHAHVDQGVVTLTGSVCDEHVHRGLVVLAENAHGVASVRDELAWIEPNSGILVPPDAKRAG
jgi:CBS domain-containing protein